MAESPTKRLTVAVAREADGVVVQVRDTGPGMSAEVQAKLFKPFFTTKKKGEGTGLGLSTSKGLVDGLGGRLKVESAPGEGATFTVTLPPAPAPASLAIAG
jgi:signal transduction histidine kinase